MKRTLARNRRGAVAISIVMGMVLLQVSVVVVVLAGARDQGQTAHRLSTTRAFYAAEAGMQMSIREWVSASDFDGDGAVGTISDDGNPANDPTIGGAAATVSYDSTLFSLTSNGRHDISRRKQSVMVGSGGAGIRRRLVYCEWPGNTPQCREWSGSSWAAPGNTVTFGPAEKQYWATIAQCPTRMEVGMAASVHGSALKAVIGKKTSWGNTVEATSNVGSLTTRPFWLDYERISGDGLLVYRSGNQSRIYYRTWNGTSWSAQSWVNSPVSGAPRFLRLAARPGSDQMMLYIIDDDENLGAMVWDGSTFGNAVALESEVFSTSEECAGADWESISGECMVVWGRDASPRPRMRIWNGTSWGSATDMGVLPASASWVRVVRDPVSDKLLAGFLDGGGRVSLASWDGSAWSGYTQVTSSAAATSSRSFDIAFEGDGTRAVAAWGIAGSNSPRYRVWTGSSWGSTLTAPAIGGNPLIIQLNNAVSGPEVFLLGVVSGGQSSLYALKWDGASFGGMQMVAENVSGPSPYEVFMTPAYGPLGNAGLLLQSWAELPPD